MRPARSILPLLVLDEVGDGDAEFASSGIAALAGIQILDVTEEVDELAGRLLAGGLIPAKAAQDAFHVAVSAVHGMDYLLTWNCTHINKVRKEHEIAAACLAFGCACPILCTPAELMPIDPPYE